MSTSHACSECEASVFIRRTLEAVEAQDLIKYFESTPVFTRNTEGWGGIDEGGVGMMRMG